MLRYFFLMLTLACSSIVAAQFSVKEGLYRINKFWYDDEGNIVREQEEEQNYLFKDSIIIFDRQIWQSKIGINFDDYPLNRYAPIGYTYFDLRTGIAQDYYTFSDTAVPINKYTIPDTTDFPIGPFYGSRNDLSTHRDLKKKSVRDTSYEGQNYKILECTYEGSLYKRIVKFIYNCDGLTTNLIKKPESLANCFCVRRYDADIVPYVKEAPSAVYRIMRPFLMKNEEMIFQKWKENIKVTKLPLSTQFEAWKGLLLSPIYMDYYNKTLIGMGLINEDLTPIIKK